MARGRRKQDQPEGADATNSKRPRTTDEDEAVEEVENGEDAEEPAQPADKDKTNDGPAEDEDEEDLLNMVLPEPAEPVMNSDGTGSRLIITHVDVENFKSYYGKQTLGPFHKNFTAIIGPNGSGKSNVIDSLLFVFGYRATKIRSKKLSVLIHSSAGHDNVESCTVTVHFEKILDEGRDLFRSVADSRFSVSRTAWRDNSSRYTYNGRTIQFKQLATILRRSGIDLDHNRFLILQGEVEQISLMKPKVLKEGEDDGMLEYLADIIGTTRLNEPIAKLEKRMEKITLKRKAQALRSMYAEKEKAALDGPAKDLVEQLKINNGITHINNRILHLQKYETQQEADTHRPQLEQLEGEHAGLKDQLQEVLRAANERQTERKQLVKRLDDAQDQLERAKTELNEQRQALAKTESDSKRLKERCTKTEQDIGKEEKKIAEYEKAPEAGQEKIQKLKDTLADAEQAIQENSAELERRLASVEEQTAELCAQKKIAEADVARHTAQEDEVGGQLVLAQEELNTMEQQDENQRRVLAGIKDSLVDAERNHEAKTKELAEANQRKPAVSQSLQEARAQLQQLRDQETQLVDRQRELQQQVGERRQQAEQSKSGGRMLDSLMKEKQDGRLPGIFGRLGDLGGIDAKYDAAISTTCGALDNIVVDTVATAEQCIRFLRENNLGVATFVALDKQQHLKERVANKPKTPEDVPRMVDLIRVADERVLPAFYYALHDTLVADTIDAATRISNNTSVNGRRWRVVTLNGEVVEISGTMTGGGGGVRRGRIGRSATVNTSREQENDAAETKRLEAEQKRTEQQLADLRQQLPRLNQTIAHNQAEAQRLERVISNAGDEVETLKRKIECLRKQVTEQEERIANTTVDQAALDKARKKVADIGKVRDKVSAEADTFRTKVAGLNAEIERIHESLVGRYQKSLDEAEAKKSATQKAISKEQSAINAAERNLKKSQTHKADLERDLLKARETLEGLEADAAAATERITQLTQDVEQRTEEAQKADQDLKAAAATDTEHNKRELELNRLIEECGRKIKEVQHVVDRLKAKAEGYQKEISKLKLHEVHELLLAPADAFKTGEKEFWVDDYSTLTEDSLLDDGNAPPPEPPIPDDPLELEEYTDEQVAAFKMDDLQFRLTVLQQKKAAWKKELNLRLLDEYLDKKRKYESERQKLIDIVDVYKAHDKVYWSVKRMRSKEFMRGFKKINLALMEMYRMITLGGDAELELINTYDAFDRGIRFTVRPPLKTWKQITNLSGGEKTLASLALVFALHHYRPTPLYVMDEIDAALDYRNVSIIGHYVKERTANAQFIIISLRNNMFERADRWIGICKVNDCTKNFMIDMPTDDEADEDDGPVDLVAIDNDLFYRINDLREF